MTLASLAGDEQVMGSFLQTAVHVFLLRVNVSRAAQHSLITGKVLERPCEVGNPALVSNGVSLTACKGSGNISYQQYSLDLSDT